MRPFPIWIIAMHSPRLAPNLAVLAAAACFASNSFAADLPSRSLAPLPPPVAAFGWNGLYVGIDAGYTWASSASALAMSSATLAQFPPIIPVIQAAGSNAVSSSGGTAGGQIGYNVQMSPLFVAGLEGDINWSGLKGGVSSFNPMPVFGGGFVMGQTLRSDWQASVRARIGVTPADRLLVYATGGLAMTNIRFANSFFDSFLETEYAAVNTAKAGWTLGGGLEYALTPNWSVKAEYLHAEYPSASMNGASLLQDFSIASVYHQSGRLKTNTVRAGVNYHFDFGTPAAVVARY